jgi:ferritin-like metal-binding protein YciE
METQKERMIRYLDDAWAVEKALVDVLDDMSKEGNDPQARQLFAQHRDMTHQQEEMLEARIRALGAEPSGGKGFMNTLMGKVGDLLDIGHDDYDKTTRNLTKAFATENFEQAMYESMAAYADAIGDTETAQLARTIQAQEQQTAQLIWPHVARTAARAIEMTEGTGTTGSTGTARAA